MSQLDTAFLGSIPELYDRYLGPLLFQPYAAELAARLADLRQGRVLETAAGTGVVTRAVAGLLPGAVEITATDLNQAMLDLAQRRPMSRPVRWQQADALALPFEDQAFDAVVCQFGVMFFPDKVAGFGEARRVLRPGGRFLFSVWDRIEANDFAEVVTEAVAGLFPHDPPAFLRRTPHGYHDTDLIRRQLEQAGFATIDVDPVELPSRGMSPADPAVGFCQGTPMRGEIEARGPGRLDEVTEVATRAVAARFGSGPVEARMRAYVFTATR